MVRSDVSWSDDKSRGRSTERGRKAAVALCRLAGTDNFKITLITSRERKRQGCEQCKELWGLEPGGTRYAAWGTCTCGVATFNAGIAARDSRSKSWTRQPRIETASRHQSGDAVKLGDDLDSWSGVPTAQEMKHQQGDRGSLSLIPLAPGLVDTALYCTCQLLHTAPLLAARCPAAWTPKL